MFLLHRLLIPLMFQVIPYAMHSLAFDCVLKFISPILSVFSAGHTDTRVILSSGLEKIISSVLMFGTRQASYMIQGTHLSHT